MLKDGLRKGAWARGESEVLDSLRNHDLFKIFVLVFESVEIFLLLEHIWLDYQNHYNLHGES